MSNINVERAILSGFVIVMFMWRSGIFGSLRARYSSLLSKACHKFISFASKTTTSHELKDRFRQEQNLLKKRCILQDVEEWQMQLRKHTITRSARVPGVSVHSIDSSEVDDLPYIVGSDISFIKGSDEDACVAIVVMKLPKLEVIYEDISMVKLTVPYIPGFLAFREAEHTVEMVNKLRSLHPEFSPLVVMLDGNGTLHENEFGLACHVGVLLDLVTVGVAKSPYLSRHLNLTDTSLKEMISGMDKVGDVCPLTTSSGKVLGVAFKSTSHTTKPVYISPGHKISMETAINLVKLCCRYRVPEPIRQADIRSRQFIRDNFQC